MIISVLINLMTFTLGVICGIVLKNNEHKKAIQNLKEDVDGIVDKAEDGLKKKWRSLKNKF